MMMCHLMSSLTLAGIVTTPIEYILATKRFDVPLFNPCDKWKNITAVSLFLIRSVITVFSK